MKRSLSVETAAQFRTLERLGGGLLAGFQKDRIICAIRSIASTRELLAAPGLLRFAYTGQPWLVDVTARAIHQLVADAALKDLFYLDGVVREISPWGSGLLQFANLTQQDVQGNRRNADHWTAVLGLTSFHRNGFVREAAVKALAEESSGEEIRFLLMRVNDWVPQVRTAAVQALLPKVTETNARALTSIAPVLGRLRNWARDDHEDLLCRLETALGSDGAMPHLREACHSHDRAVRRACSAIAVKSGRADVCADLLDSTDPVIRLVAARSLLSNVDQPNFRSFVDRIGTDKSPAVRQVGLRAAIMSGMPNLRSVLEASLLDPSRAIRGIAAYYAKSKFGLDVGEFYRARLNGERGRSRLTCLLGLGEYGEPGDVHATLEYLEGGSPKERRTALRALGWLDLKGHAHIFNDAVTSPTPGISKEAKRFLCGNPQEIDGKHLERAMVRSGYAHSRKNALCILARTSKWQRLRVALKALRSGDPELADQAFRVIDKWIWMFNRNQVRPTEEEVENILGLLEDTGPIIGRERATAIAFYLPPGDH